MVVTSRILTSVSIAGSTKNDTGIDMVSPGASVCGRVEDQMLFAGRDLNRRGCLEAPAQSLRSAHHIGVEAHRHLTRAELGWGGRCDQRRATKARDLAEQPIERYGCKGEGQHAKADAGDGKAGGTALLGDRIEGFWLGAHLIILTTVMA